MKKTLLFILAALCCSAFTAEKEQPDTRKKTMHIPPRHQNGERSLRGHLMWRAFAELPDTERREMMKLQRNDPEKFRKIMMKKVEKLLQTEQNERTLLKTLAKKYNDAAHEQEKKAVANQISMLLRKRFDQRLRNNRKQLEAMKKRTMKLEMELNRREKNADKIIEFQLKSLLDGKFPAYPHRKNMHPGKIPGKQLQ